MKISPAPITNKTIIRVKHKKNFTVVSNFHLEDPILTWKGTSILSFLLSRPDDWQTNPKHLAKVKKDGIKSVYSGLKELKDAGYIEHRLIRDEQGKIIRGEYIIYEEPWLNPKRTLHQRPVSPETHFGNAASENAEKSPIPNTDCLKNTDDDQNKPTESCDENMDKLQPGKKLKKSLSLSFCNDKETNSALSIDVDSTVQSLMNEISPPHRSAGVQNLITNALKAGHKEDYIKNAIAYTSQNSTKSFGGYLANCINQHWHEEFEEQQKKKGQALRVQTERQKQELKDKQSKADALKKEEAEHNRKLALIDGLNDITALDRYILSHDSINDFLKNLYRKGKAQVMLRKQYVEEFLEFIQVSDSFFVLKL